MLLLLHLACTSPVLDETGLSGDTAGDTGASDTGIPTGLNGTAPATSTPLPTFTVRNQLEASRTEADLVGHPTVLWFYPAAGTYG